MFKFVGFCLVKSKMIGFIINFIVWLRLKWVDEVLKLGYVGN